MSYHCSRSAAYRTGGVLAGAAGSCGGAVLHARGRSPPSPESCVAVGFRVHPAGWRGCVPPCRASWRLNAWGTDQASRRVAPSHYNPMSNTCCVCTSRELAPPTWGERSTHAGTMSLWSKVGQDPRGCLCYLWRGCGVLATRGCDGAAG